MANKDERKKPETPPKSALNVMRGVAGGHDGMPENGRTGNHSPARERHPISTEQYVEGVRSGDRTMLGRTITLIESNTQPHQDQAQDVLKALMPYTGNSIHVGITGVPGAGKSTFIETLGSRLTSRGHKVAVMAVDPSSSVTRGSILGYKTRMEQLSQDPNAFIRPSPSGGTLGGVARKTRETMLVFEAAGYDVLLVETVGVGQSDITVRSMVDFFLLILIAGAGDELQGIKKGVMELADTILVNKADRDNVQQANLARAEYERALHYLQPATKGWKTKAVTASALEGTGLDELWEQIVAFEKTTRANGEFMKRRAEQTRSWLHSMLEERLKASFYSNEAVVEILPGIEQQVMDGSLPATQAAWKLLRTFEDFMIRTWKGKDRP